eukprot:4303395-Prymnesium_polylepis.2
MARSTTMACSRASASTAAARAACPAAATQFVCLCAAAPKQSTAHTRAQSTAHTYTCRHTWAYDVT